MRDTSATTRLPVRCRKKLLDAAGSWAFQGGLGRTGPGKPLLPSCGAQGTLELDWISATLGPGAAQERGQMATLPDEARDELSFGPFSLMASERLLARDGVPVELGARAFDILVALISAPNG